MKTFYYIIVILFLTSFNSWSQCYTSFQNNSSLINISPAGGSATKNIVFYNCNGTAFTFSGAPSWLTISSNGDGSIITASASLNTSSPRFAEITCTIPSNGISFTVMVFQGTVYPNSCSISFPTIYYPYAEQIYFTNLGGQQFVTPTFGGSGCGGILNISNVPSWLNVNVSYGPTISYSITASANSGLSKRNATIILSLPSQNIVAPIQIIQDGTGCVWYPDSDGDGWGDQVSPTLATCSSPPFEDAVNNNYDNCPSVYGLEFGGCSTDSNLNWVSSLSKDRNGNTIEQSLNYFDDLGKTTVSLSKDFVNGIIWGSESTYDSFGRIDKTSFVAPSPSNILEKVKFFGNGSSTQIASKLKTYYSNNNTLNIYQDTATQPYSQVNYDILNPDNIINIVGGNKINGEWKTGFSYTVPAAQEMYYVFGYNFFDGPLSGSPVKEEIQTKFYKTTSIDANGVENVIFTDGEGKILATARAGYTDTEIINPYPVHSLIGTQGFVDVCIPSGITTGINLIGSANDYDVYNIRDNNGVITTAPLTGGNCYRIVAKITPTVDPKIFVTNATPGVLSYSSTDPAGVKGISYNVNYYDYSINVYDKTGRLTKNIQPNGFRAVYSASPATITITSSPPYFSSASFLTSYQYNTLGQVVQTTNSDEGTTKFAYRKDGKIRYSQNALQALTYKASYTNYDVYGRPIESGVISTSSTSVWSLLLANVDNANTIPTGLTATLTERTFIVYDDPSNVSTIVTTQIPTPYTLVIPSTQSLSHLASTYIQENLSGKVAVTYKADATNINAITWYSYDIYGKLQWLAQYNDGFGSTIKTIHYEYDFRDNISKVLYQKNSLTERFIHRYTYDINNAITNVEASKDGIDFKSHATYAYYKTGELQREYLVQAQQGLDYVYTLGGKLKSINHPSLEQAKDPGNDANDIFGITLDYYKGDYNRMDTNISTAPNIAFANQDFTGNIKASTWANKQLDVPDPSSPVSVHNMTTKKAYIYSYDRNNWLTDAYYGTIPNAKNPSMRIITVDSYREGELTYDSNGNIKTLIRNNVNAVEDDLRYYYATGKNQLTQVTDAIVGSPSTTDIESQPVSNYGYDILGRLSRNTNESLYYFYNTQGLVTEVRKQQSSFPLVKFFYNERGQRIRKESYSTTTSGLLLHTTYYVLDLAGNVMSNYHKPNSATPIVQTELPIYGINRLGVFVKGTSDYANYEIKDHLGNVRAVVKKVFDVSSPTIHSFADYYPFGEQLPLRNSMNGYKYTFQGQELDDETGMEAFQLRLWDGRIGRWLSPDPYGQHYSPYQGMGNNPINRVDPDGGWETWLGAFFGWAGGGFKGSIFKSDDLGDYGIRYEGTYNSEGPIVYSPNFGGTRYNNYGYTDIPSRELQVNSSYGNSIPCVECHHKFGQNGGGSSEIGFNFKDNISGYIVYDGQMKTDFIGDKKGKNGVIYHTIGQIASPGIQSSPKMQFIRNFNDGYNTLNHVGVVYNSLQPDEDIDIISFQYKYMDTIHGKVTHPGVDSRKLPATQLIPKEATGYYVIKNKDTIMTLRNN